MVENTKELAVFDHLFFFQFDLGMKIIFSIRNSYKILYWIRLVRSTVSFYGRSSNGEFCLNFKKNATEIYFFRSWICDLTENSATQEQRERRIIKNSFNSKPVCSKDWSKVVNFPQNWKIIDEVFAAPRSLRNTNTVWDTSVNLFL